MGAFRITRGRPKVSASGFDATQTVRGSARTFIDLSAMLASVPAGNYVAITPHTLSGLNTMTLDVWQNPSLNTGAGYLHTKRELAKNLTVTTSGMADGNGLAWVTCVYNSGAGETGSPVTWTLGLNVLSAITTWNLGAKTKARLGGPLLSQFGDGSATAITSQKDKNGTTTTAFEVFYGRLVWASTNGTSTTYGDTRAVSTATALSLTPFTVTLNNGAVITLNAVGGQWDVAPAPSAVIAAMGNASADQLVSTMYNGSFARNDVIIMEDGVHNVAGDQIAIVHSVNLSGADTLPTAPTGWNTMDLTQTGWLTITSRTPWGATYQGYSHGAGNPDYNGTPNTANSGSLYMRFTNLKTTTGFSFLSQGFSYFNDTARNVGWVQVDSCYMDLRSLQNHHGTSSTASFFDNGTSTSLRRHNFYVHDNWTMGNNIGMALDASDSEAVGNRIESCSEDCFRIGLWDSGTTYKSKVWWNFMPMKWWGTTGHPDFVQWVNQGTETADQTSLYPVSGDDVPANFTSTLPVCSFLGNVGCPDSDGNHLTAAEYNAASGTDTPLTPDSAIAQMDAGEGLITNVNPGRFYTFLYAGNVMVTDMSNGYYTDHQSSASRFDRNTMINDWYSKTLGRDYYLGDGSPGYKTNGPTGASIGTAKNSVMSGTANWAGVGIGAPSPTVTNCNTSAYGATETSATLTTVFANPLKNWSTVSRLQDVLDAVATIGAEAGRGAVADRTKVDHRNRTADAAGMFA